ncbi:SCO family protein [Rhizosphaericola mali]|uniref:SCO family protein n=1 Tax=Rhizosphaericola mali TaxID=2545455 RepID=A0A5P2G9J0_9BACT|nr:SCO family protein [Rhizosphaericola mali]QES89883.1 SCO family protein [Rhizosphaericola mali]
MKGKRLWFYISFFVIVAILFTVALYWGTDNWKAKPAVMNNVKPFAFETQDGRNFTRQNMIGKVCVVEYFFTHCTGICPHLNTNMKEVYNEFKDHPDFLIMSHTCDPERDSASQLKHYSDSLKIDNNKWVFLTGRKDSLYKAARESYLLDDPKNALQNINDQFIHTQFWAVVDKNGMVRGQIFDGLKKDEIAQMEDLVKELLKEKVGPTNTNFILN